MTTTPTSGSGAFSTKPVDALVADTKDGDHTLERSVGLLDLSALGLGAIIGTGIFVILGEAIGDAGPAIVLSFVLAGVTCAFSALSYAEMASTIPVAGSAYTYSYATMGELIAWIIGWDLILEYGVSVAAVAVGWGGYLNELLDSAFGFTLPDSISQPPGEGGVVNLPAVFVVLAVAALLIAGLPRERAHQHGDGRDQDLDPGACSSCSPSRRSTRTTSSRSRRRGPSGIVSAASLIFFAYIGFDAISTSGEETKNPQKRPADRDHRVALRSDRALHPRRARRDGRDPVQGARRLRGAAGRRARARARASPGARRSSRSAR